jgi:hypothetical protein
MSKPMPVSEEDLKHLQTWARESLGPGPHAYRPIQNTDPFGDSPICKVCHQCEALCAHDQGKRDIPRLVLAAISAIRGYRKRCLTKVVRP